MRLLVLALAAAVPAGSAAAPAPPSDPVATSRAQPLPSLAAPQECRLSDLHEAERRGPVQFKRLDELPAATGYMAVYRTVDGCEVPMTVVEYRQGLGR